MISFIRKHPVGVGAGAVAGVAVLAWLAFGIFGVHTLFIDDVVDEAGPVFDADPVAAQVSTSTAGTVSRAEPDTADPSTTAAGDTATTTAPESAPDDPPTDDAAVAEEATGDEPDTATQPTAAPAAPEVVTEAIGSFIGKAHPTDGAATVLGNGTGQRFLRFENFETDNGPDLNVYLVNSSTGDVSDFVDLGELKGNIGDQNYEVPEGVDLSTYDTVVIWCVRFSVSFGEATLAAA